MMELAASALQKRSDISVTNPTFLITGPADAAFTVLLAHGAGAPMDSAALQAASAALVEAGFRVVRFEFGYMAARRVSGIRKPPPRAETLKPEFLDAVAALGGNARLIIGGKSMGGRVASMVADALYGDRSIAGLLCLGYPFHPPDRPESPRTAHLAALRTPTLICQGSRDPFGSRDDVAGYDLSPQIRLLWLEDGDHDLKPRKTISGFSAADHLRTMAETAMHWAEAVAGRAH